MTFPLVAVPGYGQDAEPVGAGQPQRAKTQRARYDLIVVPGDTAWLAALAAPVAARAGTTAEPVLVVSRAYPFDETLPTIMRPMPIDRCLVFELEGMADRNADPAPTEFENVRLPDDPSRASLQLARKFWGSARHVVIADPSDVTGAVLGSALAAHMRSPLIFVHANDMPDGLPALLGELGVTKVTIASQKKRATPAWTSKLAAKPQMLDQVGLEQALIKLLDAKEVRNVVLTRTTEGSDIIGPSVWLAPYLSLCRRSAIAVVDTGDPTGCEEAVAAFVTRHELDPRTITILADLYSIGMHRYELEPPDGADASGYAFEIEPFMRAPKGKLARYGVGRIHADNLPDASLMFARGIARERALLRRIPRMLMVANPNPEFGRLPLCETVSRATAGEFKNAGVKVKEFYGRPSDDTNVLAAAVDAHLIVYEGHLGDQRLFEDPTFFMADEYGMYGEDGMMGEGRMYERRFPGDGREQFPEDDYDEGDYDDGSDDGSHDPGMAGDDADDYSSDDASTDSNNTRENDEGMSDLMPMVHDDGVMQPVEPEPMQLQVFDAMHIPWQNERTALELGGMPVVMLQSCRSLDEIVARQVLQCGGSAVVGSVTAIHSASGSSFIKAITDGVLYRDLTLGEAMRDARNYIICLADLKTARGHIQQSKAMRVAHSFRLWGDPELRVFARDTDEPEKPLVRIEVSEDASITITAPAKRLATARTDAYELRLFPGSQAAGLVKTVVPGQPRKLLPLYFFRVDLTPEQAALIGGRLRGLGETRPRAAWRLDESGRALNIVYFPSRDRPNAVFKLRFDER